MLEFRRLIACAALACAAAACALGQGAETKEGAVPPFVRLGDPGAEAARLLKSKENRERAWGAYLAGLCGLKGEAPSLVSILEDETLSAGGPEESAVLQAALDALIRLDAEVPAEALLPLYERAADEVLILLARSPERNRAALLTLFKEETTNVRWLAAGNLLAQTRAPGFAARLLGGLKIQASVYVYDRGGEHEMAGSGMNGGGGCAGGGNDLRGELPPVGYYSLDDVAARGAAVLANGPHVVYYRRGSYRSSCPSLADWFDRDWMRVEYLGDLLRHGKEATDFEQSFWHEVVCRDAKQCRDALAGARDEIRRAYGATLRRLLEENLLDGAEAAQLKPDITLDVTDARDRKSFPLPGKLEGVKLTFTGHGEVPEAPAGEGATPPAPR